MWPFKSRIPIIKSIKLEDNDNVIINHNKGFNQFNKKEVLNIHFKSDFYSQSTNLKSSEKKIIFFLTCIYFGSLTFGGFIEFLPKFLVIVLLFFTYLFYKFLENLFTVKRSEVIILEFNLGKISFRDSSSQFDHFKKLKSLSKDFENKFPYKPKIKSKDWFFANKETYSENTVLYFYDIENKINEKNITIGIIIIACLSLLFEFGLDTKSVYHNICEVLFASTLFYFFFGYGFLFEFEEESHHKYNFTISINANKGNITLINGLDSDIFNLDSFLSDAIEIGNDNKLLAFCENILTTGDRCLSIFTKAERYVTLKKNICLNPTLNYLENDYVDWLLEYRGLKENDPKI